MKNFLKNIYFTSVVLLVATQAHANTDRYRLVLNSDPSTTVSIQFCASDLMPDYSKIRLYWGTVDEGTNYFSYQNTKLTDRNTNYKDMRNGFFRLTGLQPKTRYYFVIVDGNPIVGGPHVSPRLFFETISNNPEDRLSIISGGDSRVYQAPFDPTILEAVCSSEDARKRANRMVAKLRPDAVWFNGDFTFSDNGAEWACWLKDWQLSISADGRITPMVPAQGNHEVSLTVSTGSGAFADGNSINEILDAANPLNDNYYYALNFGGSLIRLYTLNTLISILGDQTDWLAADLQASKCNYRWKLAQYHYPMRPHNSGKAEQDDQRDAWGPLFEQNHVQLAIESDSHLFKYTKAIKLSTAFGSDEGFIEDSLKGTVYIGEGGWGAELRAADDAKDWTISTASIFQFQLLFIDKNKIEIRTVLTDMEAGVTPLSAANDKFTLPAGIALYNVPGMGSVYTVNNPHNIPTVNLGNDTLLCNGCSKTLTAPNGYANYLWSNGATTASITVNTPGNYSVTVTDAWGCTAVDDINLFTGVLALTQFNFVGGIENGKNKLWWGNAIQPTATQFIIEKYNDNTQLFEKIAMLPIINNTSSQGFANSFVDNGFNTSKNSQYRIKTIDVNGNFYYSKIVTIYNYFSQVVLFDIVPNPAQNSIKVSVGYVQATKVLLNIIRADGSMVLQKTILLHNSAITNTPIDISMLAPGIYIAILQQDDNKKYHKKIIKIK